MSLFCWQCRKKLEKRADGTLIFVVHKDEIGNEHRVHKICGASLGRQTRVTAQTGDTLESMGEFHDRQEDIRELRMKR